MHFIDIYWQVMPTLHPEGLRPSLLDIATLLAVLGIVLGVAIYRNAFATAADLDPLERMMPGVFRLLNRKFYFDELYANTFGKLSYALAWACWSESRDDQYGNHCSYGVGRA